ncbi:MAG: hypothetical protein KatS3mg111_3055 [Pirellulaceae bacterium]|nr:MAG: hypothetical protein KatS3mg111_3055 [Pirellulaceae bacterium]
MFSELIRAGRPQRHLCVIVDGVFGILRKGAPWRDLSKKLVSWSTVRRLFDKWNSDGMLDEFLGLLRQALIDSSKIEDDLG